ncbi:MAG: hypothetical protein K6F32_06850, partial [Bacilli bacterium]|nr:hypothetical protein [Bacilli bacterium]
MSYISGSFFNFNYEFDDKGNIVDGGFTIEYDGLTKAEDVTASYAGKYNVPETATGSYAYKFTLRDDIKWDDGTGVTAADFVYTMKEQLNPLFQNYRADSFYAGSLQIANAHDYLVQGQSGMFASKTVYGGVYDSANDADMVFDITGATGSSYLYSKYIAKYASYIKTNGIAWLLNTGLGWGTPLDQAAYDALAGKTLAEIKADATLKGYWDSLIGWWQTEPGEELDFF